MATAGLEPAQRETAMFRCGYDRVDAAVPIAREAACHLMRLHGVPRAALEDVALVLGELTGNAVRHTAAPKFWVRVEWLPSEAVVEVADGGPIGVMGLHAVTHALTVRDVSQNLTDCGRGLFLVKQLCALPLTVAVNTRGGLTVTATVTW